jgi:hypothetical protein
MGIATNVVLAWEAGTGQPNEQQFEVLVKFFGFDHSFPNLSSGNKKQQIKKQVRF